MSSTSIAKPCGVIHLPTRVSVPSQPPDMFLVCLALYRESTPSRFPFSSIPNPQNATCATVTARLPLDSHPLAVLFHFPLFTNARDCALTRDTEVESLLESSLDRSLLSVFNLRFLNRLGCLKFHAGFGMHYIFGIILSFSEKILRTDTPSDGF